MSEPLLKRAFAACGKPRAMFAVAVAIAVAVMSGHKAHAGTAPVHFTTIAQPAAIGSMSTN
ncbi:MAG: hypothetical protein KGN34_18760 [Sphingomonadales bacterium]|nr:hypothetical protein [Sphingomonadales bacterium]